MLLRCAWVLLCVFIALHSALDFWILTVLALSFVSVDLYYFLSIAIFVAFQLSFLLHPCSGGGHAKIVKEDESKQQRHNEQVEEEVSWERHQEIMQ